VEYTGKNLVNSQSEAYHNSPVSGSYFPIGSPKVVSPGVLIRPTYIILFPSGHVQEMRDVHNVVICI